MAGLFVPDDWDAMRSALRGIFTADLGAGLPVVWGRQHQGDLQLPAPAPSPPYVSLKLLVPPGALGQAERRSNGVAIQVSEVLEATDYAVTIVGSTPTITSGSPTTAIEIRDALIAEINPLNLVVARALADDVLNLDPIDGVTYPTIDAGDHLLQRVAEIVLQDAIATWSLDVFAKDGTAVTIAERCRLALEKPSGRGRLSDGGWGLVSVEGVRGPNDFAGSQWIDRAGFDLRLACRLRAIDLLQYVEQAAIGSGSFT